MNASYSLFHFSFPIAFERGLDVHEEFLEKKIGAPLELLFPLLDI
jgi:hypothetical protein